jgi:hypothetical protein
MRPEGPSNRFSPTVAHAERNEATRSRTARTEPERSCHCLGSECPDFGSAGATWIAPTESRATSPTISRPRNRTALQDSPKLSLVAHLSAAISRCYSDRNVVTQCCNPTPDFVMFRDDVGLHAIDIQPPQTLGWRPIAKGVKKWLKLPFRIMSPLLYH